MTVGELAERTGVATSALRFYEERGLLHPERNDSGHRRYLRPLVRRVAFIVFAQRVGFTLEEIRAELEKLPTDRVPTSKDWDRLTRTWSTRINERIEELKRLKLGLTGCIGAAACRWRVARSSTRTTAWRVTDRARGTGWGMRGRPVEGRKSPAPETSHKAPGIIYALIG